MSIPIHIPRALERKYDLIKDEFHGYFAATSSRTAVEYDEPFYCRGSRIVKIVLLPRQ